MSDAYSSDEETAPDTKLQSSVLLGLVDFEIDSSETPTIEDTFIGGQPVWLHPQSRPTDAQLLCGNCGAKMALLLQAFSPFGDQMYDRVIYIFSCMNTKTCSKKKNSVKAIRGVCKDPQRMADLQEAEAAELQRELDAKMQLEEKQKSKLAKTKDLFGTGAALANPFAAGLNPFSAPANPFAAALSEGAAPEKPKDTTPSKVSAVKAADTAPASDLPSYLGYFVYVQPEKFRKLVDPILEKYRHLTEMDFDPKEGALADSSTSLGKLQGNAGKVSAMLDDAVFEAFTDKLRHNPAQVLRYDIGGKPLLYTGRDSVAAKFLGPECTVPSPGYNPSLCRQFELQLMPRAILDLEELTTKKDLLDGMEWGTIIVCTDVEDYMPQLDVHHVGYIEEWCGVQWEELV